MLTQVDWQALSAWAGSDLMWNNGRVGLRGKGNYKGARPNSANKRGLREFLTEYQNGICVFCDNTAVNPQLCHIVGSGPERRGFVPGNIVIGCTACNYDVFAKYGEVVPMAGIARPDLIATVWPSATALQARGKVLGTRVA